MSMNPEDTLILILSKHVFSSPLLGQKGSCLDKESRVKYVLFCFLGHQSSGSNKVLNKTTDTSLLCISVTQQLPTGPAHFEQTNETVCICVRGLWGFSVGLSFSRLMLF